MNSQLIIDVNPKSGEARIALLEDSQLMEFRTQKKDADFSVGDIYVGVVHKVMQNHNAAFVDIGYKREGFLHYKDLGPHLPHMLQKVRQVTRHGKSKGAPVVDMMALFTPQKNAGERSDEGDGRPQKNGKITDCLKNSQLVLVQVAREPYANKGPSLTTDISIAGRNMVLMPFNNKLMISSRISSKEENARLRRLMRSILPPGFGAIIRTAAEGKTVMVLHAELEELVERWRSCLNSLQESKKYPQLLLSEINSSSALIRDNLNGSFSSIQVNDKGLFDEIKGYMSFIAPNAENIVKLYTSKRVPIFDNFDVTKQVKRLLGRTVDFHKGSYLIIQHTEAFHVIDVNSGSGSKKAESPEDTAFEVNFAACDEIARQLRLRDMGGIIVIDFIDMTSGDNRRKVYERMRKLMSTDKVTHKILPLTDFGLMQITRQRLRPEQRIDLSEKCPACNGTGKVDTAVTIEDDIERHFSIIAEKKVFKSVELRVHPFVEAYLTNGIISRRRKLSQRYGCKLKVRAMSSYSLLDFKFFNDNGNQISL